MNGASMYAASRASTASAASSRPGIRQVAVVAPLVAQLADAVGGATLHLEAATFLAGAGEYDEAARHLAQIPAGDPLRGAADALTALTQLMTGQHREAPEILETIEDGGGALLRARAEALLGVGQASEALEVLERVIAAEPRDAVALELAAQCCTALERARDATRYSKAADSA
jgi:thioredoxin-like negative regulator of GroEL